MANNVLSEELKDKISQLSQNPNIQTMEDLSENLSLDFSQLSLIEKRHMLQEIILIKSFLSSDDPAIKLYELLKNHLESPLPPIFRENIDSIQLGKLVSRDLLASKLSNNRYDNGVNSINNGVPAGKIEIIKGSRITLGNLSFYGEFKKKYEDLLIKKYENRISVDDFEMQTKALDTMFAETIILSQGLDIQINNHDIGSGDPYFKTLNEIIESAKRSESMLKKLGYKVEYVVLGEEKRDRAAEKAALLEEIADIQKIIDDLKSELEADKMRGNELDRRPKEEMLLKREKEFGKLKNSLTLLEKDLVVETKEYHIIRLLNKILKPDPIKPDPIDPIKPDPIDPIKPDPIDPIKPDPIDPIKPDPIDPIKPDPIDPIKPDPENISIDTVLSNTFQTHQENARLYAEEHLKDEYKATHKLNLFKRANFFFSRGKIRKNLINTYMKDIAKNKAFTMDTKCDSELTRAANRHSLEKKTKFGDIEQLTTVALEISEVNQLAQEYVRGAISENDFKDRFNGIVENYPDIQSELQGGNIEYFSTNILDQLKVERGQYELMDRLSQALMTGADLEAINQAIRQFILDYQISPKFLNQISPDLEKGDVENLKKYFQFRESLREQELKNLKIKLHVLDKGKAAYQIDNSKNKKGWLYKLGNKLDTIPWYYQVPAYAGLGVLVGATGGALGMGVVAASALKIGVFAGTTGFMNFVKKWGHYTKEHNTHEKNRVSANKKEKALVQRWQNDIAKKGALNRAKRYKAKRQLELYKDTTHSQFESTKELAEELLTMSASLRPLSAVDQGHLSSLLLQSKVRLDAYLKTGHNFLYSDSPELLEQEMNLLWKSLDLGAQKLGITFDEINNLSTLEGNDYVTLVTELESDYEKANRRFKKERTWLATKYGVTTAAVSAGFAVGTQAIMGNGFFSQKATENLLQGSGVDHFTLGGHEITGNSEVAAKLSSQLSGLHPDATMEVLYSAGTDNIPTKASSMLNTSGAYQDKMTAVISNIKSLGLSSAQESAFLREIASKPWESDRAGKAFSNDFLHGYRTLETLEKAAEGLASSGNGSMVPDFAYDATRSIAGAHGESAAERFGQVIFKIKNIIPGVGENTSFVPLPLFFNTFKKKEQEKENQNPDQIEKGDKDLIPTKPITDKPGHWSGEWEKAGNNPFDKFNPIPQKPFSSEKIGVSPRGTVFGGDIAPFLKEKYPEDFKLKSPEKIAKFVLDNGVPLYKDPNFKELYDATLQVEEALKKGNRAEAEKILVEAIQKEREYIAEDSFGPVIEKALSAVDNAFNDIGGDRSLLPNKDKIHIVGNYEFWGQKGRYKPNTLGFCSYMNGELFINRDALFYKDFQGEHLRQKIEENLMHTIVHEMVHGTSTSNYWHQYKDEKKLNRADAYNKYPNARRLGAMMRRFSRNSLGNITIQERGRGLNEAITEHFTLKILKDCGQNAAFNAYKEERDILSLLSKNYNVDMKDFYKLLVNRKGSLETINKKLSSKTVDGKEVQTPRFYTLLMSVMDYEFDQNSDYTLTEALILGGSLTITPEMKKYFHPGLLDNNGLVKQEILEAYPNLSDAEVSAMAA